MASDSDESINYDYQVQRPPPTNRMTITLSAGNQLLSQFKHGESEMVETESETSNCMDDGSSPKLHRESATSRLEGMDEQQIQELIEKLDMGEGEVKSSNSDMENEESKETDMIVDSGKEEPVKSAEKIKKNVEKAKKAKKLVKPKNKEAVLSEGVNSESEEQDISDKQTIKPKREKKVGVGTQKEIIKTTTKSVTNKIAENLDNKQSGRNKEDIQDHTEENYVKPKPVTKKRGQAKPNNESEDKNKIAIKSDKKNKEDNQVQIEENYAKSKPVNKGKVKPNNDSEGEPPKVQDEKAKEKSIKVPKNKKEAKITEEIDKTTNTEKANEKLVKKTKPTSKIVENKENETSNKVDGDAEEIPVTRKRVPRKNNAEQVEKGVLSDHTNEEPIKKKTGRPKATENPAVEPKKNEKTGKKAKANEVEKPKDSKKTQQPRAKKVTETQPMATEEVLPKRSTRNKKV